MLIPCRSKVFPRFDEDDTNEAHSHFSRVLAEKYHGKAGIVLSHLAGGYHRIKLDADDTIIILHYSQLTLA